MPNEPPLPFYEEKVELMGSNQNEQFSPRFARFILNHIAKPLNESAPFSKPAQQLKPVFKGWKSPPIEYPEWVDEMAGKHSASWMKSGIFDSIMSSIYEIPCNHDLISSVSQFWTPKTNTFVFPWGEATITLEDVMILGGFSVLGDSVDDVDLVADLAGKVEVMNRFRSELIRSRSKKASHSKWIRMFMKNQNENEHQRKLDHEIEHIGFLSLWLSRFVFPSVDQDSVGKHVIPIAVKLSQGVKLALAPAILAYIYDNLTKLKEQSVDSNYLNKNGCINLSGPFQLVQIWGYERFPVLGPKAPNELRPGELRLARWHTLKSNVSLPVFHSHMINLKSFFWRPYAVDLQNWKQPLYYQDSEQIFSDSLTIDDDLQSFICFITPCELKGLGCKEKYHPHRVAMQFGFDQDIPVDLSSYKSSKFVKFVVPSRLFQPWVSKMYSDWWKNVDQMNIQNNQDSSINEEMKASVKCRKIEQEDCDKKCDFEFVDLTLEDEFDDVLMSLRKICNSTKRKIDSINKSCVCVPQSKKKKLGSELRNVTNDAIIID